MISERPRRDRKGGASTANTFVGSTTPAAASWKIDYVYKNDDHDGRRGPRGEEHQDSPFLIPVKIKVHGIFLFARAVPILPK
jgi:hypothetical protein